MLEDRLICQYGPQGELDRRREREYTRRELTAFRHDRTGMLTATLRLDPASEATFTAAVQALAAPHLDEDGQPDPRHARAASRRRTPHPRDPGHHA